MPAISGQSMEWETNVLVRREWTNTVGQSGMTPTAFAFLIPVFVVVVFCPFLCAFCIRKRRQTVPAAARPIKKPTLPRAQARERLNAVTEVSNATSNRKILPNGTVEEREQASSSASVLDRECAICLSTLHAPSPPPPALLPTPSLLDEAATRTPPLKDDTTSSPEEILKLHICGHEFHADCLVSWVVLRKTSCPICRAVYISKEEMTQLDEEATLAMPQEMSIIEEGRGGGRGERTDANGVPVSNWRYFWAGESIWNRQSANGGAGAGTGGGQQAIGQERTSRSMRFWTGRGRRGVVEDGM